MTHGNDFLLSRLRGVMAVLPLVAALALAGCEPQEEKVFDLDTPGVDVEVNKSKDGDDRSVEIETGPDAEN